jgi:hypothetical protein
MSDPTPIDVLRAHPALLDALRKAIAQLPKRLTMHPIDWEALRLGPAGHAFGGPFGIPVTIDCDAELGHPEIEFMDGSTRRLGGEMTGDAT